MSSLALDGSAALAWCFDDEETETSKSLRQDIRANGAIVPRLWRLEIANALLKAERRGRLTSTRTASLLNLLREMPIVIDDETDSRAFGETLQLARTHKLSAYDAAYLELALRKALPLATFDRALARAAQSTGVKTLPVAA